MKKLIRLLLALTYVFGLAACSGSKDQDNKETQNCMQVWSMGADYQANIEQSNAYRALWSSLEWAEDADPSRYNYIFFDGKVSVYYDSLDGVFYDMTNNKHAYLSEETNNEIINSIKDLTFVRSTGDLIID